MTVHAQIQTRITAFVTELEALVRAAAIDAVTQSLGGPAAAAPERAPGAAEPRGARMPASSGGKRDPKVLAATVGRTAEWIRAHPGNGVEAISAGLKLPTKDLALPISKLLGAKRVKKTGAKRATKYFPV